MKKIIFYTLVAFSFLMISCDDDNNTEETNAVLTTEQAQVALTESSNDVTADIVGITQSEGIEGLRNFFDLLADTDPFGGRSDVSRS